MTEKLLEATEKLLRMPTNNQAGANAKRIADQQECVSREAREWLFRFFLIPHYGILNQLRTIGIVRKILAQSRRQVPDADDKKSKDNRSAKVVESLPQMRFEHRHKKRGEE